MATGVLEKPSPDTACAERGEARRGPRGASTGSVVTVPQGPLLRPSLWAFTSPWRHEPLPRHPDHLPLQTAVSLLLLWGSRISASENHTRDWLHHKLEVPAPGPSTSRTCWAPTPWAIGAPDSCHTLRRCHGHQGYSLIFFS